MIGSVYRDGMFAQTAAPSSIRNLDEPKDEPWVERAARRGCNKISFAHAISQITQRTPVPKWAKDARIVRNEISSSKMPPLPFAPKQFLAMNERRESRNEQNPKVLKSIQS